MREQQLHVIGHNICPYVQRVLILMQEKKIPYIQTDIELDKKPEWLAKISPTGKVPILVINDTKALFESSVICEYLDEISPGSLHPDDILKKATQRAWIVFASGILDLIAKIIYRDQTLLCVEATLAEIHDKLWIVEQELSDTKYFSGLQFHLIDAVYATVFRHFAVISSVTTKDIISKFPKIKQWNEVLRQRKSVQDAVPKNYNELLIEFIKHRDSYIASLEYA